MLAASLLFAPRAALCAPAESVPVVYTTLPWMTKMARFIAGSTMKVRPMSSWNDNGSLKIARNTPRDAVVIALDPHDAEKFGLEKDRKNMFLLYGNLPVAQKKRNFLQFDPSTLPFLSQRLLVVLSRLQPDNYSFYQRRLAEFQSRLESTLEVGRIQIHGVKLLDLTEAASPWLKAAAATAVRPPDDIWAAWSKGERIKELTLAVAEAEKRGWWIVVDAWTPDKIRVHAVGARNNLFIKPPQNEEDFFTYLHDIYLQMWSTIVRR
jgi:hypothetical protein